METSSSEIMVRGVAHDQFPRHIAIIMDGNGRWAQALGKPRVQGHQEGAKTVRRITEECARLEIEQLTLYCLSSENWKRPAEELEFLMVLLSEYLVQERDTMMKNNLRLKIIGKRDRIPAAVQAEMDESLRITEGNTGTCLCLAINYGGRSEIVDAVQKIATQVVRNELSIDQIDEKLISDSLYTAGMTDPDLLLRTAGELRISNYLLWQISYAEMWVTHKKWPEFAVSDFHDAIEDYSKRSRRFGGLNS